MRVNRLVDFRKCDCVRIVCIYFVVVVGVLNICWHDHLSIDKTFTQNEMTIDKCETEARFDERRYPNA